MLPEISEPSLIDIHTHNQIPTGILGIRNIFPNQAEITSQFPSHLFSMGIHPWYLHNHSEQEINELLKVIKASNIVAIGEIGLDRTCDTGFSLQDIYFKKQIEIAGMYKKPVIIHCVRAYPEVINIKKDYGLEIPWIIHGFNGNQQIAEQLLMHHFYLSFGPSLLKSKKIQDVFIHIPEERIFLETDDSDIPIGEIYLKATKLIKINLIELKKCIFANFQKCFL